MILNLISIYLFLSVLITMYLGAYVRSKGGIMYIKVVFYLSVAVSIYMYGYSAELMAATGEQALLWNRIQYFAIPFVSALWLTVSLMYSGYFYPITKWKIALIFVIPFISFVLRMTNDYHHLYFQEISYQLVNGRYLLNKIKGPWYCVQMLHAMIMVLLAFYIYIRLFIYNRMIHRGKLWHMFLATVFAVLGMVMNGMRINGLQIDYMVLFLPFTVFFVIRAILKHDFLEIKALAREQVFNQNKDALLLLNQQLGVVDYNLQALTFFEEQSIDLKEGSLPVILENHHQLLEVLLLSNEINWSYTIDDYNKHFQIESVPIYNDRQESYGYLKIIRDFTEHQDLLERLRRQASMDVLSGLLNRRGFMEMAELRLEHNPTNRPHYLVMMDLDHFKEINDQYGHQVGDHFIEVVGQLLREHFRESDIIGRIGGEEFALLLAFESDNMVFNKIELFRKSVEAYRYERESRTISITISIGVAKAIQNQQDCHQLMINADRALYVSKNGGRNKSTFYKNTNDNRVNYNEYS